MADGELGVGVGGVELPGGGLGRGRGSSEDYCEAKRDQGFFHRGPPGRFGDENFLVFSSGDYSRGGGAGIRNQARRYEVEIVASWGAAAAPLRKKRRTSC